MTLYCIDSKKISDAAEEMKKYFKKISDKYQMNHAEFCAAVSISQLR